MTMICLYSSCVLDLSLSSVASDIRHFAEEKVMDKGIKIEINKTRIIHILSALIDVNTLKNKTFL